MCLHSSVNLVVILHTEFIDWSDSWTKKTVLLYYVLKIRLCVFSLGYPDLLWSTTKCTVYTYSPSSSHSGPRFTLQTPTGSLPHIIHNHRIDLGSVHFHPKCRLPQEPSAPPPGDVPSQSPPAPPQLAPPGLWRAGGKGAVGGPAPPGQLEDPVEGPPVQLPLLFTQPGLSQLPLHLLLSWPFSQLQPQEPLPQQGLVFCPILPAQCGRSDWGRGDGCGHR